MAAITRSLNLMLTGPQQKFAEAYAVERNAKAAYMLAYPKSKPLAAEANGSRLIRLDKVKVEIERIRREAQNAPGGAFLTIEEKRRFAASVVRARPDQASADNPLCEIKMSKAGEYYAFPDKLAAIKLDNDLAVDGAEAGAATALAGALAGIIKKKPVAA